MMELTDKYYKALGFYCPSLFYICLDGKGRLKDMKKWEEVQQSTFLHEYAHFLQDITTTQGLINMYRIGEYLRYVTTVAKDPVKDEIHIPVDPIKTTGYNLKNNWQLSDWTIGERTKVVSYLKYHKVLRGTITDDITKAQLDIKGIDLDCLDKFGNIVKVEFGTLQMMEGMAKEVEELAYPSMKGLSPYNPYYIARDVADSIIKGIGGCGDTMIALYDLALQSSVPGNTFVCYLEEKAKQGYNATTLTADVIYNELLTANTNHSHLGQVKFQAAYENAMSLASGVIRDFTGGHWVYRHIDVWYNTILNRARLIRLKYPRMFIELGKQGNIKTGALFNELLGFMGTPLVSNEDCVYESKAPRKVSMWTSEMADVYAMIQTQQVFVSSGKFQCALTDYCANKKCWFRKHKVDVRCVTEPWTRMKRFNRCPFCQWWYYKGFSKTKFV